MDRGAVAPLRGSRLRGNDGSGAAHHLCGALFSRRWRRGLIGGRRGSTGSPRTSLGGGPIGEGRPQGTPLQGAGTGTWGVAGILGSRFRGNDGGGLSAHTTTNESRRAGRRYLDSRFRGNDGGGADVPHPQPTKVGGGRRYLGSRFRGNDGGGADVPHPQPTKVGGGRRYLGSRFRGNDGGARAMTGAGALIGGWSGPLSSSPPQTVERTGADGGEGDGSRCCRAATRFPPARESLMLG